MINNPRSNRRHAIRIAALALVVAGVYTLATYTIFIDATTAAGTYTLSTTSLTGSGWVGAAPTFSDNAFNSQGSFALTVTNGVGTVVPEPTGAALILGAMFPLVLR